MKNLSARIYEYDKRNAADAYVPTEICSDTNEEVSECDSSWYKACSPLWLIIQYKSFAFNLAQAWIPRPRLLSSHTL